MKMYFFSNTNWGNCYTIMAEDEKEAIQIVKRMVRDGKRDKRFGMKERKRVKMGCAYFDIIEYSPGEVLETEYA